MTPTAPAVFAPRSKTASKSKVFSTAVHAARVVLGLIFFVFGLNGFFHFITMPAPSGTAAEFAFGLSKAPYFYPLMALVQTISGLLLLTGALVPFAVVLLFPISLNIFLFHLMLAPEGLILAAVIMAAHLLLVVNYWTLYRPVFQTNNAWNEGRRANRTNAHAD